MKNIMPRNILVVCVGNICRSPMAAALLQRELDELYTVSSAGIGALVGEPADPMAVDLLHQHDVDLSGHVARQVDEDLIVSSELIFAMENAQLRWIESNWPQARGRAFLLGHWGGYEIPDPYRHGEGAFRRSLSLIQRGIGEWRDKLRLLVL